ncbi:MAG: VCBS repeat-containing protein [Myxococcaceae bacterium]|nr:VCBS repeat-containing protein [Myxococcaceae bacterium]
MTALVLALALAADYRLDDIELLNDSLEDRFDAICSALKGGARTVPDSLAAPGAHPVPKQLVWVTSCSLRALKLDDRGVTSRAVHLLWELEGRDANGGRAIERGEADGRVKKLPGGWRLEEYVPAWSHTVQRDQPRYLEVGALTGLVLPPRQGPPSATHLMASGLAVRDFDGDGRLDFAAIDGTLAHLFRNVAGGERGYHFERSVLAAAPKGSTATAVVAGDFDNDGDADLVVLFFQKAAPLVLKNEGGQLTPAGSLDRGGRLHSALASDLDGDGNLDLAIVSYPFGSGVPSNMLEAKNGEPVRLYKGDGRLGFKAWPVPGAPKRWGLAAQSADLLGLGRPQLYVANDFGSNDLFVFDADGGIRNVAKAMGLDDPGNGMSADVADLDSDGRLDLYVANMFSKAGTRVVGNYTGDAKRKAVLEKFSRGNTVYVAQPDGGFTERAVQLGVNRGLWAFGSVMYDADDDGRLEVAVANGYYSDPRRKDL